jgi:hypothetical protein
LVVMVMVERDSGFEEKVPFGDRIALVISKKVDDLWKIIKTDEVDYPKFSFKVGVRIMELGGPETLLKFLGKNELKDKELVQKLEKEARSRIDYRKEAEGLGEKFAR